MANHSKFRPAPFLLKLNRLRCHNRGAVLGDDQLFVVRDDFHGAWALSRADSASGRGIGGLVQADAQMIQAVAAVLTKESVTSSFSFLSWIEVRKNRHGEIAIP